ncbi:MAG: nucleotidyltransferase family protein [Candidatus Pacebacteria bacterium]|nr:nucleotidyltransferase family protein [Candidatus Paceibacterota bacterium]NUQ56918.1 nucleotidyltransferase family protein [Candidatus Paceibacter sp.]
MQKEEIKKKIAEAISSDPAKNDIEKASLFGSFLNNKARNDSDVDILVEFKPTAKIGFFEFVRLQRRLSDFVGKKVDLLTPEALSKFFKEKVIKESELVYGGK